MELEAIRQSAPNHYLKTFSSMAYLAIPSGQLAVIEFTLSINSRNKHRY